MAVFMPNEAATILLVDGDLQYCLACKASLESQGYRVVWTSSGREALAIFSHQRVDLVVAEVRLSDMGGFELIGSLAAQRQGVPIVVNTADAAFRASFRSWAADAIIPKSTGYDELARQVRALLPSQRCVS